MNKKNLKYAGVTLDEAQRVLVMLHGRGANADDILSLANYLHINDFALIAPEATNHTWYPYSFIAPIQQNEPWLTSALLLIHDVVNEINNAGIKNNNIYFLGFSQGACLTLEYIARNAAKFGGVAAFTGGLIGDKIYNENYRGDFKNTKIFIGTSDPDMHVPVSRVEATAQLLKTMNADVKLKIYKNIGHTIIEDEINIANQFIFN